MMKRKLGWILVASALQSTLCLGADEKVSLSDQLKGLEMPENQAPLLLSEEQLYSVQTRYVPLKSRFELSAGGGQNFTGDSFLVTRDLTAGVRYHLSDRWSLGLSGSLVFNSLSDAGTRLLATENLLPDSAWAKNRMDLTATYNLFVGKFRLSMNQVFYFDQYISLGGGLVSLQSGQTPAAVADIGFAFWWSKHGNVRLGFKDYFYREKRQLSSGMAHNLLGHIDIGYLLGGGGT